MSGDSVSTSVYFPIPVMLSLMGLKFKTDLRARRSGLHSHPHSTLEGVLNGAALSALQMSKHGRFVLNMGQSIHQAK